MRYFLAIVLPPLAVLFCGKPISAILNLFLCVFGWIPGVIHAFFVVNSHKNQKSMRRIENRIMSSSVLAHQDASEIVDAIRKK